VSDEPVYEQSGVVPVRTVEGAARILLIRNRSDTRWIVPKGLVEAHLGEGASALEEAYEEAGVRGVLGEHIGWYRYSKWGGTCRVSVFLLNVEEVLEDWPESFRERIWVGVDEALDIVDNVDLRCLIRRAAGSFGA
jgi:phosphohistidine phosphatase